MPSRSSQGVRVASSRLEPDPRVSQQQNNDNMVDAEESAGEETYTAPTIFCWTREAGSNQINLVINMPGGEAEWKGSENTLVVPEIVHSCKQPNGDYTIILGVASFWNPTPFETLMMDELLQPAWDCRALRETAREDSQVPHPARGQAPHVQYRLPHQEGFA